MSVETPEVIKQKLEIEKLTEEVKVLKAGQKTSVINVVIPVISVLVSVTGFFWGARQAREQVLNDQTAKSVERQHDFLKYFTDKQVTTYFALCESAATIAAHPVNSHDGRVAQLRFIKLYQGSAWIVSDESVRKGMDKFYNCTKGYEDVCKNANTRQQQQQLQHLARELSSLCRASMAKTANADASLTIKILGELLPPHHTKLPKGL